MFTQWSHLNYIFLRQNQIIFCEVRPFCGRECIQELRCKFWRAEIFVLLFSWAIWFFPKCVGDWTLTTFVTMEFVCMLKPNKVKIQKAFKKN